METKQRVMDAAIAAAGEHGLSQVRIRHIALICGVAEGTIYRHFTGKEALLAACFQEIDKNLADSFADFFTGLDGLADWETTLRLLWQRLCSQLLEEKDRTRFYFQFRDSPYFCPEMQAASRNSLVLLAQALETRCPQWKGESGRVICFYLFSHAQWFVRQVLAGELKSDGETAAQVFSLLYHGMDDHIPAIRVGIAERENVG